jgi:transposase
LVDELGLPQAFLLTGGQISDYTPAIELLGQRKTEAVIADKGYDSDKLVQHVEETMQAKAVIPPRSNRKQQREYDKTLYKLRNRIERCFSKLKQFRRFATRYEKSKDCFQALVALACAWINLQLYVDTA